MNSGEGDYEQSCTNSLQLFQVLSSRHHSLHDLRPLIHMPVCPVHPSLGQPQNQEISPQGRENLSILTAVLRVLPAPRGLADSLPPPPGWLIHSLGDLDLGCQRLRAMILIPSPRGRPDHPRRDRAWPRQQLQQ